MRVLFSTWGRQSLKVFRTKPAHIVFGTLVSIFRLVSHRRRRGRRKRGEWRNAGDSGVVFKPGGTRQQRRVHQTRAWLTCGAHAFTRNGRLCRTATHRDPSRCAHTHIHTQKHSTKSTSVYPNDYENILPFVSKIMFKNELIKLKQIFCPFHFLYWSYFSSYMTNYAPHFNCALSSVN